MKETKLYEYYARERLLPTFSDFSSESALNDHERMRHQLFAEKLKLPIRLFNNAEVLEFGPDTGENAMVFARWGGRLTLVEPNGPAHEKINAYFRRFGLAPSIRSILESDVERFGSSEHFDIIIAEGFIYTVPLNLWLERFSGLLATDGVAVASYYERFGATLELALKAIYRAGVQLAPSENAAVRLFETKWNAVSHSRPFLSWQKDVLDNPFVRLRTFIDASELLVVAQNHKLVFHAAWPNYSDSHSIYWHKKVLSGDEQVGRHVDHIRRSRLSYVFGHQLFLVGDDAEVQAVLQVVDDVIVQIDALIDDPLGDNLQRAIVALEKLMKWLETARIFAAQPVLDNSAALLNVLVEIFNAIGLRDFEQVAAKTNGNKVFVESWGMPNHFLALRKIA